MASSNPPERGQREELLRAELEPLGADERPPALRVAMSGNPLLIASCCTSARPSTIEGSTITSHEAINASTPSRARGAS